jgi:hypothetical protein
MKRTLVSALIVLAPLAPLAAQQPPQPSAPGTVVVSSLRRFGNQYGAWLTTAFDSVPAAKYGYKPTPAQMSVGQVAAHLEEANYSICGRMSGMTRPMTARDSAADTVKATWPKDTLVARLKASFDFCKTGWDGLKDAQLVDSVPGFAPGHKIVRATLAVVFVTDLVDHYSQMANYMRLNGMIPPSSYPRPKM